MKSLNNEEKLKELVVLRQGPLLNGDESFIYNSWLRSYRSSPECKLLDNDTYYSNHKLVIENILKRPSTVVIVACNPSDPEQIYGWQVEETYLLPNSGEVSKVVHYIYVKYNFRRMGIATMLFNCNPSDGPIPCTHQSYLWDSFKKKTNGAIFYDSYIR